MMARRKGGRGSTKEPFEPTEDWENAYEEQFEAPEFGTSVRRWARNAAARVARVEKIDQRMYAEDLLQGILADTLDGEIRWDPSRVSLLKHVFDAIRSRARHARKHAEDFPLVDVDGEPEAVA